MIRQLLFLSAAVLFLASCQTGRVKGGSGLLSYFDTCGIGSTWRYEGTIWAARRTGQHQHDINDQRSGHIVIERTLIERRANYLGFTCRAWINGTPVSTLFSVDWQIGEANPDRISVGPLGPSESTWGGIVYFEDWPMSATPSTAITDTNKFYTYELRLRPMAGTQTINGKTVPVGAIERWEVLKRPTPGLSTDHKSTVWVNDQFPGRITRIHDRNGTTTFDISLKSYKIVPR